MIPLWDAIYIYIFLLLPVVLVCMWITHKKVMRKMGEDHKVRMQAIDDMHRERCADNDAQHQLRVALLKLSAHTEEVITKASEVTVVDKDGNRIGRVLSMRRAEDDDDKLN